MNNIQDIESRFLEVTGLPRKTDLTPYPLTEHIGFDIRNAHKKESGEVFTPLELVDRMLEISNPDPTKFNMDLCAGRGQFTIRILRRFVNQNPDFNIRYYLTNLHWFNELNVQSCIELIYIFGETINLAIGPAQELKNYPSDFETNIWNKGIYYWDAAIKKWVSKDIEELNNLSNGCINSDIKVKSKSLF